MALTTTENDIVRENEDSELALAPYAARSSESRGRTHAVSPDLYRTEYQRDRDRIIHCVAFRKLEYKTQVYVIHEGDYYRTRLTHTLEVAQIARTLAGKLGLNVDLTETIALSHDLGHTPFGHSGEAALQKLLADRGGFEHNRQSLRVIELLEQRYHDIPGLNLTWEVREGIAKHTTAYDTPGETSYDPHLRPTLEAQVCDLADEIAYNHHDLDDALELGMLEVEQLREMEWLWEIFSREQSRHPEDAEPKFVRYRAIGHMMGEAIGDVLTYSAKLLAQNDIASVDAVREFPERLMRFSPEMHARQGELKRFLLANVYHHPHVVRMQTKAERFVTRLFNLHRETPTQLPLEFQARIGADGLDQVIVDYISGMTDTQCMDEYIMAFEPTMRRRNTL